MPSLLTHLSLKQKLLLFFLLPLIAVVIVVSLQFSNELAKYHDAQRNTMAVSITRDATALIYELQKERGLSVGYNSSQGTHYYNALQTARSDTDEKLKQFITNPELLKLAGISPNGQITNPAFKTCVPQLLNVEQQLAQVRAQVTALTPKSDLNFYTEYVHNLMLLIRKLQTLTDNIPQNQAYSDLLQVLTIQEAAGQERAIVNRILVSPNIDLSQYQSINAAISEQQHAYNHAEQSTITPHQQLFSEQQNDAANRQVIAIRRQLQEQLTISSLAYQIAYHLGYGGLIHDFKNYLLQGQDYYKQDFYLHQQSLKTLLQRINSNQGLTDKQRHAIATIETTLQQYQHHMEQIPTLRKQKLDASQIDRLLMIPIDRIAHALEILQQPAIPIRAETWWMLSSERILGFNEISNTITDNIAQLSNRQQHHAVLNCVAYLVGTVTLLLFCSWFGMIIIRGLMISIRTMANEMQSMGRDPDLKLTISPDNNDEINQIAEAINRMLSERQKADKALRQAAVVFDYSAEGIVVTNAENEIELVNPAFTRITGYSQEEVLGQNPRILNSRRHGNHFFTAIWDQLLQTGSWDGEIWNKRKNGEIYPEHLALTLVRDSKGAIKQHIGLFTDISKRKQYEQDIWYQANFDSLTGLPNRQFFNKRLEQEILMAQHKGRELGLIMIDLDGFKYINDVSGHSLGDSLLTAVGKRLSSLITKDHFLARTGGDEFMLIIPFLQQQQEAEQLARKIQQALCTPFTVGDDKQLLISASQGIGIYPEHGIDVESLSRNTETAMYQAKEQGRNTFKRFTPGMNKSLVARIELEQRLRRAVTQEEFCLHYQPIVDMQTGKIHSAEALIRWQDPERGMIGPDQFIPIAEETGLIEDIGLWVLNQALADLSHWQHQGLSIRLAINVSSRQCKSTQNNSFPDLLAKALQHYKVEPQQIHIEITESMLMSDTSLCQAQLNAIADLGCDIYLDDFGTGYSSLSYLKKFPISVIKIDRSFMENIFTTHADANLIKAIINMGRSLEMQLVAEGIETRDQWDFLKALGCNFAQGYLIAKPLAFTQFTQLLTSQQQLEQRLVTPTSVTDVTSAKKTERTPDTSEI
ncbi:diguanylate cyclase [Shewanella sp. NFH-SH190041]|uniref:EAL domain-containing protein n=1 Tax=Shewanella sp. NFH-SH190041 TaxID=2950245 RepID=UPI0021C34A75|nr:EAL domain-containing protein [Shewanella sp. NFH-SH190041]BDM62630.1 diguanylate cyclase [Shewanella sp. NFH-SH190041]